MFCSGKPLIQSSGSSIVGEAAAVAERMRPASAANRSTRTGTITRSRMQIDGVRSGYLRCSLVSALASVLQGSW